MLENAALDLVQAVVVLVENLARGLDVDPVFGQLRPRQLGHELEVGAHHRILGRRVGHALEPAQFAIGLLGGFLGQLGLVQLFAQALDFLGGGFVLAQFALDGAHLLAQHGLALVLAHALLGLLVDIARQAHDFQPVVEKRLHTVEPWLQLHGLENLLFFLGLQAEVAGHGVGEQRRRGDRADRVREFARGLVHQFDRFQRAVAQVVHARVDMLVALGRGLLDPRDLRAQAAFFILEELAHAKARDTLTDQMMVAVGAGDIAHDVGPGADTMQA